MDYYIRFEDGSELPVRGCGENRGYLWIYTAEHDEHTMMDYAVMFSDKSKTSCIEFHYGSHSTEHSGFTEMVSIAHDEYEQNWSICMKKVADGSEEVQNDEN